ncbi:mechanosensitive ion channel [Fulvivirgaceae bacterium BMA10]|uniref:Mechanosensitive ion channel n=1 Tax=Splendidivirga corallicola TaxID=3051826 RepID=A0ABT8KSS1_9BACT|nr:mechanosensitive ion channel [Fulvivirgaceae bacterium BMA10]
MEKLKDFLSSIYDWLKPIGEFFTSTLFKIKDTNITLLWIISFVLSFVLLVVLASRVKRLLIKKILPRYKLDSGLTQSIGTMTKYTILVIGFFIIITTAGIDLSALGLIAGALGVGIGFGLQNITNNFISGLIILFERPIKVGDRIEVGDISGDVVEIGARATTVLTNDNINIILPNSHFIDSQVINWSHNDRMVRFRFPVGVSYNEDPRLVRKLLLEVAEENHGVLKKPQPDVLFDEFGESSLNFYLVVWTKNYTERPKILKSQLYYAIFKKFKDNNIEIPFPQRDLHIKSGLLAENSMELQEKERS